MKRLLTLSSRVALDVGVLALAYWVSFLLRFEGDPPHDMVRRLVVTTPYVVVLQYLALVIFDVPRFSWRHVGLREAARIGAATALAAVVLLTARLAVKPLLEQSVQLRYALIPMGVVGIDLVLAFVGLTGVRASRRLFGERSDAIQHRRMAKEMVPTLLVGAGEAGLIVAKELERRPDLGMTAVGFIDDDPAKQGSILHGLPVLGPTDQLLAIARSREITQVLITIASASGPLIRKVKDICETAAITVKIVPGISEIVGGQFSLSAIREIAIEDLLRRPQVELNTAAIGESVHGRVVMVTGAGGSIGSEMCRQICQFGPTRLLLVEISENNLFHIHRELVVSHPEVPVVPWLADVADEPRMAQFFSEHKPELVLHAAAHKHVPMMEWNAVQAIRNNVVGTRHLAKLSEAHGVQAFVMISTDKAVRPTSIMGASKRVAELFVQAMARAGRTRFVTVRFGNVLGSQGSVVPIFREQIARGGPVTVTHPDMVRYFMTIPEACQLVLQAQTLGRGGEIFILDMGEPVRIVDLAHDLIRLSGLVPDRDVTIEFTGIRPGEKLFEELSHENLAPTSHPSIRVEMLEPLSLEAAEEVVVHLVRAADAGTDIRTAFAEVVSDMARDAASAPSRSC